MMTEDKHESRTGKQTKPRKKKMNQEPRTTTVPGMGDVMTRSMLAVDIITCTS